MSPSFPAALRVSPGGRRQRSVVLAHRFLFCGQRVRRRSHAASSATPSCRMSPVARISHGPCSTRASGLTQVRILQRVAEREDAEDDVEDRPCAPLGAKVLSSVLDRKVAPGLLEVVPVHMARAPGARARATPAHTALTLSLSVRALRGRAGRAGRGAGGAGRPRTAQTSRASTAAGSAASPPKRTPS